MLNLGLIMRENKTIFKNFIFFFFSKINSGGKPETIESGYPALK